MVEKIQESEQKKENDLVQSDLKTADILAYERTVLAQERTLMAAIRTSVSLISFGFTIAKFFQDIKAMDVVKGMSSFASKNVGYWLVLIGTAYILVFSIQHQLILKSLHVPGTKRRISFTFSLALVIGLLGIALLVSFYSDIFSLGLNK